MKIGGKDVKRAAFVVVALVALFLWWASTERAEAGELSLEAGPTLLSGEFAQGGFVMLSERFYQKWEYNLGYVSKQQGQLSTGPTDIPENIFIGGSRIVSGPDMRILRDMEIGIGMSAWQRTGRISSGHLNWNLSVGYRFAPRWRVYIRHFSNAGSGGWNVGQDQITIRWAVN